MKPVSEVAELVKQAKDHCTGPHDSIIDLLISAIESLTAPSPEQMREAFEKWITSPPIERDTSRFQDDGSVWPGCYKQYEVHLAWEAWQAAFNLSKVAMEK